MKNLKLIRKSFLLSLFFVSSFSVMNAQDQKVALAESKLTVFGTSNVHDWEVTAKSMKGNSTCVLTGGDLKEIKNLEFVVDVEQLKSGKDGMDENTYKALNSSKYKTIKFDLVKVLKITSTAENAYTVETQGDLTISGVTKRINQTFTVKTSGKKFIFSGKTKIDMTQYGVKPPKAMFGTIKTGPSVTVDFKVTYI